MKRLLDGSAQKNGFPPGSLIHTGKQKLNEVSWSMICYDQDQYIEDSGVFTPNLQGTIDQVLKQAVGFEQKVIWLNINGVHQAELIHKVDQYFNLHPLIMEDIMNTEQRAKVENYEYNFYLVLKMLKLNNGKNNISGEQLSMVVGKNFILSFQEEPGDVFDRIRDRIRQEKGQIRYQSVDYLLYTILDAVIDGYFLVMEELGEKIFILEEEILSEPSSTTLQKIHRLKSEIIQLRKTIWPLQEVISSIRHEFNSLIKYPTGLYLRDVYDHTIRILETVDTYREMLNGLLDVYLSISSNRMNEIMKILTIIATIFMPLTLISGIYGMNFNYMPELAWRWGYPLVLILMVAIVGLMFLYFKNKRML